MLDKFLVFISLGSLIAFCGILLWYVHEPDLTVVLFIVLAIAIYDFWASVFRPKKTNGNGEGG